MRRLAQGSVVVLLAVGSLPACRPDAPTGLPVVTTPAPAPPTQPPPRQPDPSGGTVYDRRSQSSIRGSQSFVLNTDGTFALRYDFGGYTGRYSLSDSTIVFHFDDWNTAGPWIANGILREDLLVVAFNDVMLMADFENGTYVRR
jgi:hypothetical protein